MEDKLMESLSKAEGQKFLNENISNIDSFEVHESFLIIHLKDGNKVEIACSNDGEMFMDLFDKN